MATVIPSSTPAETSSERSSRERQERIQSRQVTIKRAGVDITAQATQAAKDFETPTLKAMAEAARQQRAGLETKTATKSFFGSGPSNRTVIDPTTANQPGGIPLRSAPMVILEGSLSEKQEVSRRVSALKVNIGFEETRRAKSQVRLADVKRELKTDISEMEKKMLVEEAANLEERIIGSERQIARQSERIIQAPVRVQLERATPLERGAVAAAGIFSPGTSQELIGGTLLDILPGVERKKSQQDILTEFGLEQRLGPRKTTGQLAISTFGSVPGVLATSIPVGGALGLGRRGTAKALSRFEDGAQTLNLLDKFVVYPTAAMILGELSDIKQDITVRGKPELGIGKALQLGGAFAGFGKGFKAAGGFKGVPPRGTVRQVVTPEGKVMIIQEPAAGRAAGVRTLDFKATGMLKTVPKTPEFVRTEFELPGGEMFMSSAGGMVTLPKRQGSVKTRSAGLVEETIGQKTILKSKGIVEQEPIITERAFASEGFAAEKPARIEKVLSIEKAELTGEKIGDQFATIEKSDLTLVDLLGDSVTVKPSEPFAISKGQFAKGKSLASEVKIEAFAEGEGISGRGEQLTQFDIFARAAKAPKAEPTKKVDFTSEISAEQQLGRDIRRARLEESLSESFQESKLVRSLRDEGISESDIAGELSFLKGERVSIPKIETATKSGRTTQILEDAPIKPSGRIPRLEVQSQQVFTEFDVSGSLSPIAKLSAPSLGIRGQSLIGDVIFNQEGRLAAGSLQEQASKLSSNLLAEPSDLGLRDDILPREGFDPIEVITPIEILFNPEKIKLQSPLIADDPISPGPSKINDLQKKPPSRPPIIKLAQTDDVIASPLLMATSGKGFKVDFKVNGGTRKATGVFATERGATQFAQRESLRSRTKSGFRVRGVEADPTRRFSGKSFGKEFVSEGGFQVERNPKRVFNL